MSISYLAYAIRHVGKHDAVLLYNFFPEYLLAACYLRIAGRPAIIDIEDAPQEDEPGIFAFSTRLSWKLLLPLCAKKYVTVSRHLGDRLGLAKFLPVHGIFPSFGAPQSVPVKFGRDEVNVLFGGTITRENGLDLFVGAVRLLAATDPELPLHFYVSGMFSQSDMQNFAKEIESSSRFRVTVCSGLSAADYRNLAQTIDIGLSLRLSGYTFGQTSFPSKVLEFAAFGMLVCTTPVSDIPAIFDKTTAIVLTSERPEELAAAIKDAVQNRVQAAARARNGRLMVLERFSETNLGREIVEFIQS